MKREIIVGVVSSILTAIFLFIVAKTGGFLSGHIQTAQVHEVADEVANKHSDVIALKLKHNTDFIKSVKGDKGDAGKPGPPGSAAQFPTGAIIAFDQPEGCPEGWSPYLEAAGRMIIGTGKGDGLSNRKYRETGGEEAHTLSINEMPSHNHQYNHESDVGGGCGRAGCNSHATYPSFSTSNTGGNRPHNNMPPYIALTYCRKD